MFAQSVWGAEPDVMVWVSPVEGTPRRNHGHVLTWSACFAKHYPEALQDSTKLLASVPARNNSDDIGPQVLYSSALQAFARPHLSTRLRVVEEKSYSSTVYKRPRRNCAG